MKVISVVLFIMYINNLLILNELFMNAILMEGMAD